MVDVSWDFISVRIFFSSFFFTVGSKPTTWLIFQALQDCLPIILNLTLAPHSLGTLALLVKLKCAQPVGWLIGGNVWQDAGGACGSWAHLSCVKLTRRQADNIPVWHCTPCSGSSHGNIDTDVFRGDVVPSDMAKELVAAHKKNVIILKRLPKSAKALVADSLATSMEQWSG